MEKVICNIRDKNIKYYYLMIVIINESMEKRAKDTIRQCTKGETYMVNKHKNMFNFIHNLRISKKYNNETIIDYQICKYFLK